MLRVAKAARGVAGRAGTVAARVAERAGLAAERMGLAAERMSERTGRGAAVVPVARTSAPTSAAAYVVALPLIFQLGVLPTAALVYAGGFGGSHGPVVVGLCAALVFATAGLVLGVARGVPLRVLVLADTALAVAGNLAMSTLSVPSARAVEVSWQYFAGCVALWTLVRGIAAGFGAIALGAAVRAAMFAGDLEETRARGAGLVTVSFFGDVAVLLVAMLVSAGVLVVLDRDAERLRNGVRRSLHDTVLQTLEAIALTLPGDADNAARRLREVRAVAHAEAVALRRELSRRSATLTTPSVVEGLIELSTELARDGLRMRLDVAEGVEGDGDRNRGVSRGGRRVGGGGDGLTGPRRAALLAATREALRNVLKHSGVAEALVRVWDEPDGLTVVIRDFGVGFDPAGHRPGFGLSESIAARMAEVGGTATVGSRVGNGTSVTLWVPFDREAAHS